MRNPWEVFEHELRNRWPQNPTQTAYRRFVPTTFELPPNGFDEAMRTVFKTPYLEILEKEKWLE